MKHGEYKSFCVYFTYLPSSPLGRFK